MGKIIMSGAVPIHGVTPTVVDLSLGSLAEGSIVYIQESGNPIEFYVAKHNYEETLNGVGRTLLVRKDCYTQRVWHDSKNTNVYASSSIDSWLNSSYKSTLDSSVQNAMSTTTFYYAPGNNNDNVTTLSRSVFLLSATEVKAISPTAFNIEGSALSIYSTLLKAKYNGSYVKWWLRSPRKEHSSYVTYITETGSAITSYPNTSYGVRPVFTLPSTTLFDVETLLFKEVQ